MWLLTEVISRLYDLVGFLTRSLVSLLQLQMLLVQPDQGNVPLHFV